jgi:hypothetical protein
MFINVFFYLFFSFIFVNMYSQFKRTADQEVQKIDQEDYLGPRYQDGTPFPFFKQGAYMLTDFTPAGQSASNYMRRMGLASDNTLARNTMQSDGLNIGNQQGTAFVYRTNTMINNGDPISCRNNTDCSSWPGSVCNPQFMSWKDAKGNQGAYCSLIRYPEMKNGNYERKTTAEGGIGKACFSDSECGEGYRCNNETDTFGKNIQQTGFCSQVYECPDGEHFAGYPYGAGNPVVPPKEQNNKGYGYSTNEECVNNKMAQQDCVQDNSGKWFATYPGYCPVIPNMREGASPYGQLSSSSYKVEQGGFKLPSFANTRGSSMGKPLQAFSSWNINSNVNELSQMEEPLAYEMSINPR